MAGPRRTTRHHLHYRSMRAPELASYSLLPIIPQLPMRRAFSVGTPRYSLVRRILAAFQTRDRKRTAIEIWRSLGDLVKTAGAHVIKPAEHFASARSCCRGQGTAGPGLRSARLSEAPTRCRKESPAL